MSDDQSEFTPTRRKLLQITAGLAAGTLIPFGLGATAGAAQPSVGGTLRIGLNGEPPGLITITNAAGLAYFTGSKAVEGLFTYDHDLTPQPQLATEWSASEDGLTYTFKLREGVKWHDGKDFTSEDVAFSILTLKEVHPTGRVNYKYITKIDTPDAHTVVLHLEKPIPYLVYTFAALASPIVPKHLYEGTDIAQNPYNNAPVGTGPFVFKEWVRGSHIIFDRNPDYWDAPRPYVDRVIFQIITDSSARAAAIESGEINLAPNTPVPLSDIERFSKIESLVLETKGYNYTGSVFRIEFNLDNPNLAQKPVRQALAHAIDRDVLLNVAWYGHAKPTNGPVSPALTKYFIADLPLYAFDPVKAEQLLDEAGLKRGADGNRFSVSVSYIPGDGYKRSTEYLQQAFAAIGVKVDVVSQDFATYVKRVYTDRQFDISVHAMSGYYDPTPGAQRLYISTGFKPGVPFSNGSHYANARVDELLEASAVENDDKKRYEQFAEFQRIIVDDIPALTLLVPQSITIAHKSVRDHSVGADGVAGNLAFAYIQQA